MPNSLNLTLVIKRAIHDIASPLAVLNIVAYSEELNSMRRDKTIFKLSLNRVNDIIKEVRTYIQLQDQLNTEREYEPVLITPMLKEILVEKQYEYQYTKVKIIFSSSRAVRLSFIRVDPSNFKRMISNLINNACIACKEEAAIIKVSLRLYDQQLQISIADNGVGMAKEMVERLLENDTITKSSRRCIGFGQIHETVREANGKLNIKSGVGKGTEVILTFPQANFK